MNSIMVIHPYKCEGIWVFDDEKVGLVQESFVSGADDIIEMMVSNIPDAEKGFNLVFSAAIQISILSKRYKNGKIVSTII